MLMEITYIKEGFDDMRVKRFDTKEFAIESLLNDHKKIDEIQDMIIQAFYESGGKSTNNVKDIEKFLEKNNLPKYLNMKELFKINSLSIPQSKKYPKKQIKFVLY
jgi:hypothetical protein